MAGICRITYEDEKKTRYVVGMIKKKIKKVEKQSDDII